MPPFPQVLLLPQQGPVHAVSQIVSRAGIKTAVIRGHDDERIVGHAFALQRRKNFTDRPIEFANEVAVDATLARPVKARMGGVRRVHRGRSKVEEERAA